MRRIIIGGYPRFDVYYTLDGVYTRGSLPAGGRWLAQAAGYEYIQVGGGAAAGCYEIRQFPDQANRISRQLGLSAALPGGDASGTGPCERLVIYDSPDIDAGLYIQAVKELADGKTDILYVMLRAEAGNPLLHYLSDHHPDRLLIVTNAEVLRRSGMDIACGLSWESTVSDLIWQTYAHRALRAAADSGRLMVRFGTEGALRFCGAEKDSVIVFQFMADVIEGDQLRGCEGTMHDLDAPFVLPLLGGDPQALDGAMLEGLGRAHACFGQGYVLTGDQASYPDGHEPNLDIQSAALNLDRMSHRPGYVWSLLREPSLEDLAMDVVMRGMKKLANVPSARFAGLVTVDRKEIERFRAIRNLMEEYLHNENPSRPLSIAVFGTPGSGKSFGVSQIAKCIGRDAIVKVEYNLSQMRSQDELVTAFHSIQDLVLKGKIPLVFFDEFDSDRDGAPLGWLKSFLAPMQDGEFSHNGIHPIGKCIFIFAGGVFSTFDEFCHQQSNTGAKVRDFISRLKGYVNIMGPNPNPSPEQDNAYILRRAVLLRSLMERKLKRIRNKDGSIRADGDIVRAMLRVAEYRHGVRSMEAILDMSTVSGKQYLAKADLPPADQMAIHVDPDQFKQLLLVNQLLASYREDIARAVHEDYRRSLREQADSQGSRPNDRPWEELSEEFREDNRQQADDIVDKLLSIHCSIEPASMSAGDFSFTDDEVETLARREHDRWMANKLGNGWTYGEVRDTQRKKSPYLLPWEELDEQARNLDRDPVRNIPALLRQAKLAVYRIK